MPEPSPDASAVVGRPTGAAKVVVERGPVAKFADAVHNDSPVYQSADAAKAAGLPAIPAPPTYAFSGLQYWGRFPEDQPPDPTGGKNPMMDSHRDADGEGRHGAPRRAGLRVPPADRRG